MYCLDSFSFFGIFSWKDVMAILVVEFQNQGYSEFMQIVLPKGEQIPRNFDIFLNVCLY